MAVDTTTTMVTGATSRKAPKTIEGRWQAVKPPWGRPEDTEPDNLGVTAYLNNKFHDRNLLYKFQHSLNMTIDTATKYDTTLLIQHSRTVL